MIRPAPLALILLAVAACTAMRSPTSVETTARAEGLSVTPRPHSIVPGEGRFPLSQVSQIRASHPADPQIRKLAHLWQGWSERPPTDKLDIVADAPPATADRAIVLRLNTSADDGDESYQLSVKPGGIVVEASTHAGLFYGLQTLRQLTDRQGSVPAVEIRDAPRYPYRGLHLDVGRHYFPVDFIKKYIDVMAMYKLNTFHWHLTEDQGWRIEIKRYPKLTEVGAFRRETVLEKNRDPYVGDGIRHGGFYTQEEVREIVAYASERYVTVIPEIEMPGHSTAALAAYPELACTDGPFEVATSWGVKKDVYCPSEETFAFLEGVLTEVMDLFPSRYIHIGGDEAPKDRWRDSAVAQAVIEREGLADEDELQSYFIRRIETFLASHDRRLIGWDEILEGGLAPDATVMSWRGTEGGIEAAKQGHDVIMTPTSHCYFDYYQAEPDNSPLAIGGLLPLEKVYSFEPTPDELDAAEKRHILGAQGNVWTEYLKTPAQVEYMAFPRALALAEVVWSPKEARDWRDFSRRLPAQLELLDELRVSYRRGRTAPAIDD